MTEELSRAIVSAASLMERREYREFVSVARVGGRGNWNVNLNGQIIHEVSSLGAALNYVQTEGYTRREPAIQEFYQQNELGETALYFSKLKTTVVGDAAG